LDFTLVWTVSKEIEVLIKLVDPVQADMYFTTMGQLPTNGIFQGCGTKSWTNMRDRRPEDNEFEAVRAQAGATFGIHRSTLRK
jgi:hypothetical protein